MTRAIHWISSVDPQNEREIDALQARMATFYRTNTSYYGDIDFATAGWISDPVNQDIARRVLTRSHVLEIGCGAARILDHHPELAARYTGVDFSPSQLEDNRRRHPAATFVQLTSPTILPLANGLFDCVFSNFVLEHAVRPRALLDESMRVLGSRGTWLMRCPDFLGRSRMSSQRCGFSCGTGRQKLMRGAIWDAAVTAWDTRVRIPSACGRLRRTIDRGEPSAGFFVNTQPTCFTDPFAADRDAVYLTYEPEIRRHLTAHVTFDDAPVGQLLDNIYLVATKA